MLASGKQILLRTLRLIISDTTKSRQILGTIFSFKLVTKASKCWTIEPRLKWTLELFHLEPESEKIFFWQGLHFHRSIHERSDLSIIHWSRPNSPWTGQSCDLRRQYTCYTSFTGSSGSSGGWKLKNNRAPIFPPLQNLRNGDEIFANSNFFIFPGTTLIGSFIWLKIGSFKPFSVTTEHGDEA